MYSSPNITRLIKEIAGHGMYGGEKRCPQGFGGKPEGKRPLGRPWSIWEVNIKINQVVGWGHRVDYQSEKRDRRRALANVVMNLQGP